MQFSKRSKIEWVLQILVLRILRRMNRQEHRLTRLQMHREWWICWRIEMTRGIQCHLRPFRLSLVKRKKRKVSKMISKVSRVWKLMQNSYQIFKTKSCNYLVNRRVNGLFRQLSQHSQQSWPLKVVKSQKVQTRAVETLECLRLLALPFFRDLFANALCKHFSLLITP